MKNSGRPSREEIKKIIVAKLKPLGVERVALFGSFARREEAASSDIDILVTFPRFGKRKPIGMRWFVLDQELEEALGIPVDLVTEDSLNERLRSVIQRDLEVIYEKTG
jgi:predicted nucleotidyltransferase